MYTKTLYITNIVVFLTAFSICVGLRSSKIHNWMTLLKTGDFIVYLYLSVCSFTMFNIRH